MNLFCWLSWIYWNPERVVFTVPIIDRPVVWYGLWFVLGFIVGYFLLIPLFAQRVARNVALTLVDRMTWFMVAGTVIGARLGHVFFYEWPHFQKHPEEIYQVWQGGLASHGAAIGILIALYLYQRAIGKKYPQFTFLTLLDMIVIPTAFAGFCIRIGNFFNQEILGTETSLPWAVVFGDAADGSAPVPRHPVQLYEALAYLLTFVFLYSLWRKKGSSLRTGMLSGLFFILLFTARFFIEFFKMPQSQMINESFLQTGQYLSLPFIFVGFALILYSQRKTTNLPSFL